MKKLRLLLTSAVILLAGCGGVKVIDYNDKLVDLTDACFSAEGTVRDALDAENYGVANELLDAALTTCQTSKTKAEAMDAYKNDSSLKEAVVALLDTEIEYLKTFKDYVAYRSLDELTEEQEAAYNALDAELDAIDNRIVAASDNLVTVQEAFAATHGFDLEE